MVIVADKEGNGLEDLQKSISELKPLLSNVIIAADGCSNTFELTENLLETYIVVLKLEKSLQNL